MTTASHRAASAARIEEWSIAAAHHGKTALKLWELAVNETNLEQRYLQMIKAEQSQFKPKHKKAK